VSGFVQRVDFETARRLKATCVDRAAVS